ncbi:MAG: hypothetical protein R3B09_18410 [Nannocystaceae bacterium]
MAACTSQSAVHGEGPGRPESPEDAVSIRCEEAPAGALLDLDATPCPWVLVGGEELQLRALQADGPRLHGAPPEPCERGECRWDGALGPLGPLLIAAVPGGEGESPRDVWLGAALGGERLAFTRLWWGETSRVDRTDAGAIWELAPWRCGERLVLRPHGRLPEAAALGGPPPGLVAIAGAYAVVDGELQRSGDDPGDPACERIPIDLP